MGDAYKCDNCGRLMSGHPEKYETYKVKGRSKADYSTFELSLNVSVEFADEDGDPRTETPDLCSNCKVAMAQQLVEKMEAAINEF
jgi:hypothetical protein